MEVFLKFISLALCLNLEGRFRRQLPYERSWKGAAKNGNALQAQGHRTVLSDMALAFKKPDGQGHQGAG